MARGGVLLSSLSCAVHYTIRQAGAVMCIYDFVLVTSNFIFSGGIFMKKVFVVVLALALAVVCSSAFALEYGATGYETEGYDEDHAWEISSVSSLVRMRDEVNSGRADALQSEAYYKLMSDIDLSDYEDWDPIGKIGTSGARSHLFTGNFDGNGHTITMNISSPSGSQTYAGLFGYINDGTVKNLSVSGSVSLGLSTIHTVVRSGGIAAILWEGSIENCCFDGTVIASTSGTIASAYAGGIVGDLTRGPASVIDCKAGSKASTRVGASINSRAGSNSSNVAAEGGIIGNLYDNNLLDKVTGNYSRVTLGGNTDYSGAIYGRRTGAMGEVADNTEASPSDPAPDAPTDDTPTDDTPTDDTPTDDTPTDDTPTDDTPTDDTNGEGASGGGGGGGCNAGFCVLLLAALAVLKRSQ